MSHKIILLLGLLIVSTSSYAALVGRVVRASCGELQGYAYDNTKPDEAIYITIWDNDAVLVTLKARRYRRGTPGNELHGFLYPLPFALRDGGYQHTLRVTFGKPVADPEDPAVNLELSPRNLGFCASLNDTGVSTCSDNTQSGLECPVTGFEGQDADYGRDARARDGTLPPKIGDGLAGFDFTKIANNGSLLSPLATSGAKPTQWGCTLDNHTGLMWEIKLRNGGLRGVNNTYSWYNTDAATNGGNAGTQNGGACSGGISCDTEAYVAAVNAAQLCGQTGWRLPTVEELRSIVDYGRFGPAIDWRVYFANTPAAASSWSSSGIASNGEYARVINHNYGDDDSKTKNTGQFVRLVRNHR